MRRHVFAKQGGTTLDPAHFWLLNKAYPYFSGVYGYLMANNALQYIYAGFCEKPPHTDKPRGAPTTWNRVKLTSQSHARLGGEPNRGEGGNECNCIKQAHSNESGLARQCRCRTYSE